MTAYEAASQGRRLRHWRPPQIGPNSAITFALDALRNRSRDQVRQNAYAARAADAWVTNLVGTGIRPMSKAPDRAFQEQLHALWSEWQEEVDASGELNFVGLQNQIARSWFEGGECFVRRRLRPVDDGLTVPLQLQVLESEHLPIEMHETASNGNPIRSGIEFDANRSSRRVAYHMRPNHPGEMDRFLTPEDLASVETERIPAEEVLHVYFPARPGQKRGEPVLTQALIALRDLDSWNDAELTRQKMASMFVGFIKKASQEAPELGEQDSEAETETDATGSRIGVQTLEPGSMNELEEGEEVQWSQPPDVGNNYPEFHRSQLRAIAQSVGILYEQLSGDYSQVNDRTYRASHNELKRQVERLQQTILVPMLLDPIWKWFFSTARASGQIRRPRELNDNQARRVVWVAPGWRHLHPVQDEESQKMAVRSGFKSRSQVVIERGGDPAEVDERVAEERERESQLDLIYDSNPANVSQSGQAQGLEPGFDSESGSDGQVSS